MWVLMAPIERHLLKGLRAGAGVTSYSAILSAAVEPGQWLAVVGCGGLGHLVVQFAKGMGIKVLAGESVLARPKLD